MLWAGDRVRITAQLVDTNNDRHLWSDSYDRDLVDIFQVQDEIASAIVGALKTELGLEIATTAGTLGIVLASTGRLDGRIECQQIGLKGNLIDNLDNIGNFFTGVVNFVHCLYRITHHPHTIFCKLAGILRQLVRKLGIRCIL